MFSKLPELIQKAETVSYIGKIENVIGMSMESSGNRASIGDIAMIYNEEKHRQIPVNARSNSSIDTATLPLSGSLMMAFPLLNPHKTTK